MLTPVLFGVSGLDEKAAAIPLEIFLALIGIVLLTPVFQPEQSPDINDLIASKYVNILSVYMIRILYSLLVLFIILAVFVCYMGICNCEVSICLLLGTVAEAMFLGSLGMLGAAVTNHTAVAYSFPLLYYILNYGTGRKLGNFYLFSMREGQYTTAGWLFMTSVVLIFLALFIKYLQRKKS